MNIGEMPSFPSDVDDSLRLMWRRLHQKTMRHANGCWLWQGGVDACGYGDVMVNGSRQKVHRLSWIMYKGDIPDDLWVLHKCDTPACCNPEHLFLGTAQDNTDDMMNKQRNDPPRGSRAATSVLTEQDVLVIRERLARGDKQQSIADDYNIAQPSVSDIKHRRTWGHI